MNKRDRWEGIYNPDLLEGWWCRATSRQVAEGATWYWRAHHIAIDMAERTGVPLLNTVAVIATLSPRKTWGENVKVAEHILEGGDGGSFKKLVAKAKNLVHSDNPMQELAGVKTINFGYNILYPAMEDWVTIDTHMLGILGQKVGTKITDKIYNDAAGTVRYMAEKYKVLPNVVQAVSWVVYREEKYPRVVENEQQEPKQLGTYS